jgi:dihydroneopterin aldolase
MMELFINGIEVDCIIGERDYERTIIQRLVVDARLEVDDGAAESDRLSDAVDYVALAEAVRGALVDAKCKLIERAALIAAKTCLAFNGVKAAEVSVTKSGAIPGIGSACARTKLAK